MRDAERDSFLFTFLLIYPNPTLVTVYSLTTPYGCSYSSGGSQLSSSELSALEPIGT